VLLNCVKDLLKQMRHWNSTCIRKLKIVLNMHSIIKNRTQHAFQSFCLPNLLLLVQEKKNKKVITQIYLNGTIFYLISSWFLAISEIRIYRQKSTHFRRLHVHSWNPFWYEKTKKMDELMTSVNCLLFMLKLIHCL